MLCAKVIKSPLVSGKDIFWCAVIEALLETVMKTVEKLTNRFKEWLQDPENKRRLDDFVQKINELITNGLSWFTKEENQKKVKEFFDKVAEAARIVLDIITGIPRAIDGIKSGIDTASKNLQQFGRDFISFDLGKWAGDTFFTKRAAGGLMTGRNVPYLLNDGGQDEYVINGRATAALGTQFLDAINSIGKGGNSVSGSYNSTRNNNIYNYGTGLSEPSIGLYQLV